MTGMSDAYAALRGHLTAGAFGLALAHEGEKFSPTVGSAYLRATLLPSETYTPVMGRESQRLQGVLQVDVVYPFGAGSGLAEDKADAIVAHFARGGTYVSGGAAVIVEKAWRSAAIPEGAWYRVPVSVRFWSHVTP